MTHYKKALGALTILGTLAMGGTAFAQTASTTAGASATTSTRSSTAVPGAPNTGAGGDTAVNLALLGASALLAAGGAAYLARSKKITA